MYISALGSFALMLSLFFSLNTAAAVTLVTDGDGILLGADSVSVNGTLYDVAFLDGSCESLYNGCDNEDFPFQTVQTALDAAQALLDQVFIGVYDTNPEFTRGCQQAYTSCLIFTPYDKFRAILDVVNTLNWSSFIALEDYSCSGLFNGCTGQLSAYDTSPDTASVWAVWAQAAVIPLPAAGWLFMSALAGLIGKKRLSRR